MLCLKSIRRRLSTRKIALFSKSARRRLAAGCYRERMQDRGEAGLNHFDRMGLDFHNASRKMYLGFAEQYPERYVLIDAEQPFDQVCSQVIGHLMKIDGIIRRRPETN